jgi:hypothetical protein
VIIFFRDYFAATDSFDVILLGKPLDPATNKLVDECFQSMLIGIEKIWKPDASNTKTVDTIMCPFFKNIGLPLFKISFKTSKYCFCFNP